MGGETYGDSPDERDEGKPVDLNQFQALCLDEFVIFSF